MDVNMADDEMCSSPSQSSTDDSDSDSGNSATEDAPASRHGWIMPFVTGVVNALCDNTVLRLDRIVEAESDAVDRTMPRTSTAMDAAFADLKPFMSARLSLLLAIILDKLREQEQALTTKILAQQRVHDAEIRELRQTVESHEQDLNALEAKILEMKKDMRFRLGSGEGNADVTPSARSIKRRRKSN